MSQRIHWNCVATLCLLMVISPCGVLGWEGLDDLQVGTAAADRSEADDNESSIDRDDQAVADSIGDANIDENDDADGSDAATTTRTRPKRPLSFARLMGRVNSIRVPIPQGGNAARRQLALERRAEKLVEAFEGQYVTLNFRVKAVTWRDGFARISYETANRGGGLNPRGPFRMFWQEPYLVAVTQREAAAIRPGTRFRVTGTLQTSYGFHAPFRQPIREAPDPRRNYTFYITTGLPGLQNTLYVGMDDLELEFVR